MPSGRRAIARTRNLRAAGALLFTLFAAFLAIVPLADDSASLGEKLGVEGIAALSLGVTVWFAAMAWQLRDPRDNYIVDLIDGRPRDIVRMYLREVRRRGILLRSVVIEAKARKKIELRVEGDDARALLTDLARRTGIAVG